MPGKTEGAILARTTVASEHDLNYDDPLAFLSMRGGRKEIRSPVLGYWAPQVDKYAAAGKLAEGDDESSGAAASIENKYP
ncbi:hypothetical protein FHX49_001108 [Microbacterium endophyticum]|uniref:Uncharacterized protein n=1 Tax=Microbacterium endophyticum TaxID=1526412 RepID=A0A7W4V294_9MICO|nr:hypothetical protein [Microbacterium endophyticum]MBB2975542.1 hypothetical protein [Microbacterium endophyticum]NIK35439.1 hypothetical protein [Microbacterium endophyticum]